MLPMLSMLSIFNCKFPCFPWFYILWFPCFPWFSMVLYSMISMLSWGILLQFSCSMLAWKAWNFPHENHGILFWLHAPWFSRESMEFSPCFFHGFSMVFPCFQFQGIFLARYLQPFQFETQSLFWDTL